jgi:DNA (cytosine-5)-methyltransferase 1
LKSFTFGELFSGPGGLSLGLRLAAARLGIRVTHKWAVEIDPSAAKTYERNFPGASVRVEDIRRVNLQELANVAGMAFGFPCNDFSLVGEQRGTDGHFGPLYKYCVAAVRLQQPKWFVAENVGGIRSAGGGRVLPKILREFEHLGYKLSPHLFRFEEYGIPQTRHRVLIVGIRNDQKRRFRVPEPPMRVRTARQALEEPPIPAHAANHEFTKQSKAVIARLKALRAGENAFTESLPEHLRLNVKGARISQIYRRLHPDKPAYTVTGSGGGGTHVYHWSEPRALTNRERARLQTFPDDFVFEGGKEAVRRQIGMAVPPEGAAIVFEGLLRTLMGQTYPAVEPTLGQRYQSLQLDFQDSLVG